MTRIEQSHMEQMSVDEKRRLLKRLLQEKQPNSARRIQPATGEPVCSYSQERLWFVEQLAPGFATYNLIIGVRARGRIDHSALESAFHYVLERHEPLRTTFEARPSGVAPVVVAPSELTEVVVPLRDLSDLDEQARIQQARRIAWRDANTGFDLSRAPLIRAQLLRLAERDHVLLFTMHHIAVDGWSAYLLLQDLTQAYEALRAGERPQLPPLPIRYGDYAQWQRARVDSDEGRRELQYWVEALKDAPPPTALAGDFPSLTRASVVDGGRHPFKLDVGLSEGVRQLAREEGSTLFITLLTAFEVLTTRYSPARDIITGISSANRSTPQTEPLIGCFVNTLPIRVDLGGNPTFREVLRRTKQATFSGYVNREVPFEHIVRETNIERATGDTPLFRTMFTMNNTPRAPLVVEGAELTQFLTRNASAKLDLAMEMQEGGYGEDFPAAADELIGAILYRTTMFEAASIERMVQRFEGVLRACVSNPDTRIEDMGSVLFARESTAGGGTKATEREAPVVAARATVIDMLVEHARHRGQTLAIVDEGQELSYAEFAKESESFARALVKRGVVRGDTVALRAVPSAEALIALLGIIRAGASYLPLTHDEPWSRVEPLLRSLDICFVVAGEAGELPTGVQHLPLDLRASEEEEEERVSLPTIGPSDAAYVICTSGSTGTPKGVVVEHSQLASYAQAIVRDFAMTPDDRVGFGCNLAFDISVFEMFSAITAGASLATFDVRMAVADLLEALRSQAVTVVSLPTSLFHVVAEEMEPGQWPTATRIALVGGEKLNRLTFDRFHQLTRPSTTLVNGYGPAECVVCPTLWHGTDSQVAKLGGLREVPIGRAHQGSRVQVLSESGERMPDGWVGELVVSGAIVARGYANDPRQTALRFVPDPHSDLPGARRYRTGDLGRARADGELEFIGRRDDQVKLRGFRIELGEIESALRAIDGVADAAVRIVGHGRRSRLVAWFAGDIAAREVKAALRARLPASLVPSRIVITDTIPRGPGGKVRCEELPLDDAHAASSRALPSTATEREILAIFQDLLGIDSIGIDDHFFELGGHSLLATQLVARIHHNLGVQVPVRAVFEHDSVRELAAQLSDIGAVAHGELTRPTASAQESGHAPMTAAQERIFLREHSSTESNLNHLPMPLRIRGALDLHVLQATLSEVLRRHETLRTCYELEGDKPIQRVLPPSTVPLPVTELAAEEDISPWLREAARSPMPIHEGVVLRAMVGRLADDDHVLLLLTHHIACDGWSTELWRDELVTIYQALCEGIGSPLPPLPLQCSDYARWEKSEAVAARQQRKLDYWTAQLADLPPEVTHPASERRPAGAPSGLSERTMNTIDALRLLDLGRELKATPFMVFGAAYAALLRELSGRTEVGIATPTAGRSVRETQALIGCFVDVLPLRLWQPGRSGRELIEAMRDTTIRAFEHSGVPFAAMARAAGYAGADQCPILQHSFRYGEQRLGAVRTTSLVLEPLPVPELHARSDVDLTVGFSGDAHFRMNAMHRFADATMERWLDRYEEIVERMGRAPEAPIEPRQASSARAHRDGLRA